jgi:hypothetical protein
MRSACLVLAAIALLVGCASKAGKTTPARNTTGGTNAPITKPSSLLVGRVDSVNVKGRYVIISFPIGALPVIGLPVDAYREGLKVAELKITPPQQNNLTAADIVAGEVRVGDEVRTK